ncbi:putative serine/threonine protein kinase KSP1 KNAG_0B04460 [Huiozyma naganishii CBS 8797]|uniref:non-specific serine/threonine protein kinase n=1 Tax=Huiozyma naganishii (strain ATCC MYA-139 / BCRC 22969 / CBS 8797 / KCTC 17520 / NBRC 10181 / NCYC 3082 / Yp74L-3) TaxID=1071383 RepID=J7R236_HUIN7|nr:hypothetical protein KNAG_0B04460 [Kazachstania naganishii CBS 8797]CCK68880.1 hypothetical protein KNAG_0B04460 [Kazachstania naganishii CBS 8797]
MTVDYEIYKEGGILNERYQKIEDISEGSYGYVSLAKDIKEKRLVAVKYIFKLENEESDDEEENNDRASKLNLEQDKKSLISADVKSKLTDDICMEAMYEVDIQTKIGEHRNIVQLLDFFDSYIIMEYCSGGDLYEAIKDDIVPKSTKSITKILNQIMDAVEFVHNKHIYHRDIKPENILINGIDWNIKLTDWGLATTNEFSMDRSVGSERYMSPELFESNLDIQERKDPYECAKVDLWAVGIVFLNIVFHKNPFSVANQTDKSFCYFAANREALFDVFSTMAYDFFQVLRYSLTIDPKNRDLQKMRYELNNLSEYTLDDDYYNNLEEGYETEGSEITRFTPPDIIPPSSAPVSYPTPISSPKQLPKIETAETSLASETLNKDKKPLQIPQFNVIQDKLYNHYKSPNQNSSYQTNKQKAYLAHSSNIKTAGDSNGHYADNFGKERARSAPKFKFNNRRYRTKNNNNNSTAYGAHYGYNHNYGGTQNKSGGRRRNQNRYYSKGIDINNRNKSKILKDSRKPLGIPTPNTHINNFFHDYKNENAHGEHNFNTRDFFTPPSVQNKYLEGIFDSRFHKQHQHRKNNFPGNNFRNWNNGSNNSSSKSYKQNTSNNNNFNFSKYRRPSTTGNSGYNMNNKGYAGQRHSFTNGTVTSGFLKPEYVSKHSPGAYIPPFARGNHNHHSTGTPVQNYNIPNISSVLDNSPKNANTHSDILNHAQQLSDDGHDSDDILFTLEENDNSFVKNFHGLSVDDDKQNYMTPPIVAPSSAGAESYLQTHGNAIKSNTGIGHSSTIEPLNINPVHAQHSDLPDLLKSPVTSTISLHHSLHQDKSPPHPNVREHVIEIPMKSPKSGVYVPPHHRRASMNTTTNEAVLSVTHNSLNYLDGKQAGPSSPFRKPVLPVNHSSTTISLQNEDVFAGPNSDALIFEDDEDDYDDNDDDRAMFGPYQIYDNASDHTRINKFREGRKSSTLQDEIVGSLEQYKNNWLMLQQQQE